MRILIVSQYFWPETFKINDLAVSLKERGHEVEVLAGMPNYPKGKFFDGYGYFKKKSDNYNGIKIMRVSHPPRGNGSTLKLITNLIAFAFFASFEILFRARKKYDVIFVYGIHITIGLPAIFLSKVKRIPIVLWVQDLWPETIYAASDIKSSKYNRILCSIVKFIYKNCSKILISSRGFSSSIMSKGVDKNKIAYIPNWAEDFYQKKCSESNNELDKLIPQKGLKLMFAGNIGDAQDFGSIIKAAEIINQGVEIQWIIIGDGRKKIWAEQEVRERKLSNNFHFLGRYPVETMPYFFSKADAMLMTLKDEYIFSLTVPSRLQTYMACGKPVLAMINGEGAEIINEANAGFTCIAGDYKKLAENIIAFSKLSNDEREKQSSNSFNYYHQNFDKKHIIDNIEMEIKF
jgi:colanic acid biosynthesis glycosyl transferase WcaI